MKRLLIALTLVAMAGGAAQAQVYTFESPTYTASAAGTVVTGQDGWYLPASGGVDWNAFLYSGNSLGFNLLPIVGGSQFIAAQTNVDLCRAQHDFDFGASNVWTASYYVNCKYGGDPTFTPPVDNIASFSQQDSLSARYWQSLCTWVDFATATTYKCYYLAEDSTGFQWGAPGESPGAGLTPDPWSNLAVNHWYRISTTWRYSDNRILACSITDMDNGVTTTSVPPFAGTYAEWYMRGTNLGFPLPTAFRNFCGGGAGGVSNNQAAVDNESIVPGLLAIPTSLQVTTGGPSGVQDVRLVFESDDQKLEVRPGIVFSIANPPVVVIAKAIVPTVSPSLLNVVVESSSTTASVAQGVSLLNVGTGLYDVLDTHNLATTDAITTVAVSSNTARFINQTTREVTIRLTGKATAVVFAFPWRIRFDRVVLTGTP